MQCRVCISNEKNEIISNDIWYGNSVNSIKYWVDLAISDILKKPGYTKLYYEINELE